MKEFLKSFFAVDNSVNEQTVIGAFWTAVTLILYILKIIKLDLVSTELIYMAASSSLLAFGIGGFKKVQ